MSLKVSLITATYNSVKTFEMCANSVLNQTYSNIEYIIVDGQSDDGTIELLKSMAITHENINWISEADKGIYDALNKGIENTSTELVMFIHAGDTLTCDINTLMEQINLFKTQELDILLNDCSIELKRGVRLMRAKRWKTWMFKLGVQPPHPPIIYRKAFISKYRYKLSYPIISDFEYLENLFSKSLKYYRGNRILIHMTRGGKTSSGLISFFRVSAEFYKLKGLFLGSIFLICRPPLKLLMCLR